MSASINQIEAMLERAGTTNLLQKQKVDLDKERLQLGATVNIEKIDKSLEEEIERYLHSLGLGYGGWVDGLGDDDLRNLARHFAEWSAEHLRDSTKMIDKSLDEVAINYSNSWYCSALEGLNETGIGCTGIKDAFIAGWKCRDDQMPMPEDTVLFNKGVAEGRRLEREDMMKDGNVILAEEDFDAEKEKSVEWGYNLCKQQMLKDAVECEVTDVGLNYLDLTLFEAERLGLNKGDKVKVIVLKEEEE